MVYALIGIPLTMIVIADVGTFFIKGGSWCVQKTIQFLARKKKSGTDEEEDTDRTKDIIQFLVLLTFFALYIALGVAIFPLIESWSAFESVYFG